MKNKVVLTLMILFVCFIGIGCNKDIKTKDNSIKEENNSIGLPSFSDYQNLSESEKGAVIEKINSIPADDVVKYFEEKLVNYIDDKELIDISNLNINIDSLLMHEDRNQKKFDNLNINLELSIDNKNMNKDETEKLTSANYR